MSAVEIGDLIDGRFRLAAEIGVGGMGAVFRAIDDTTGRDVAIKVLTGHSAMELERARREARILAGLAHPGIVGYIADGLTTSGHPYVAMEWVPGTTLAARMSTTGFSLREAVEILRQTTQPLEAAHRAGVLHRDIKPSNILLSAPDDRVTLIDFGIARIAGIASSLTQTGLAIGTPGYMSPEQARGDREVTPATDVFALGCVFYACATGLPAFSGANAAAVLVKILLAVPAPFGRLVPEAPHALGLLVERMLEKDVARRLPDCAAVLHELEMVPAIDPGPRRGGSQLAKPTAASANVAGVIHCTVLAAQGALDDVFDPPDEGIRDELRAIAQGHGGHLEICANGTVAIHVAGDERALHRAAACALAVRERLPEWSIALSSPGRDVTAVVEGGVTLLAETALADLFGEVRGVAVHESIAEALEPAFVIVRDGGRLALLAPRT